VSLASTYIIEIIKTEDVDYTYFLYEFVRNLALYQQIDVLSVVHDVSILSGELLQTAGKQARLDHRLARFICEVAPLKSLAVALILATGLLSANGIQDICNAIHPGVE